MNKNHCLHKTAVWVRPCVNDWPSNDSNGTIPNKYL